MSIDWAEVLEKPEKSFKVPGQLLLQQRNKIEKLQKEFDELKKTKIDSDQNVASLNLRIETVLGDLEARKGKVTDQEEQIDKLKEVLAGLEDNLASNKDEQIQLTNRVTELEGTASSKDETISEQANKIAELEAKISELQQDTSKLSEKDSEISTLQSKITELENEKSQAGEGIQKKLELLENEKKSFEEHYKLKEAEIAEKNDMIEAMESKIQELEAGASSFAPSAPAATGASGDVAGGIKTGIKSQIPWKSGTGVHVCPDCGSNRTEDVKDKERVLYVAAGTPIYAKKKRCLNCGTEWSID